MTKRKRKKQMKRQEKRTESITIRVTPTEKRAIEREGKKNFRNASLETYKRLVESLESDGIIEPYGDE